MYVETQAVESNRKESRVNKNKKPGFFKRWLLKTLKETVEYDRNQQGNQLVARDEPPGVLTKGSPSVIDNHERAMRFVVHSANGGRIVETNRYDRQKDRHTSGLYVITNDQDFGKEIDKIITMEALR